MTQKRTKTGFSRKIQRVSAALPPPAPPAPQSSSSISPSRSLRSSNSDALPFADDTSEIVPPRKEKSRVVQKTKKATPAKTPSPSSSASSSSSAPTSASAPAPPPSYAWEWEESEGEWKQYDTLTSRLLEGACASVSVSVRLGSASLERLLAFI